MTRFFCLVLLLMSAAAQARIPRDSAVLEKFRQVSPCPDPQAGPRCKGWQIDHIEPLCAAGVDELHNLQWLTVEEHRWKTRTDVRVCRELRRTTSVGA